MQHINSRIIFIFNRVKPLYDFESFKRLIDFVQCNYIPIPKILVCNITCILEIYITKYNYAYLSIIPI